MKGATIGTGLSLAGMLILTGCGMHQHTSKYDLLRSTNVSLIEAVRAAETSVTNARTVEAELEREDGRIVYEVKMIDGAQQKHKVYVDAATGKIVKLD
ncbi:MAG: PepSY domain-containing protein [Nitrospira sp.]